jgi:hypothetical protein
VNCLKNKFILIGQVTGIQNHLIRHSVPERDWNNDVKPGTCKGEPVDAKTNFEVRFSMDISDMK